MLGGVPAKRPLGEEEDLSAQKKLAVHGDGPGSGAGEKLDVGVDVSEGDVDKGVERPPCGVVGEEMEAVRDEIEPVRDEIEPAGEDGDRENVQEEEDGDGEEDEEDDDVVSEIDSDDSDFKEVLTTLNTRAHNEGGLEAVAKALLGAPDAGGDENAEEDRDRQANGSIGDLVFDESGHLRMDAQELAKFLCYLSRARQTRVQRNRLFEHVENIEHVAQLIRDAKKVMVLSGAGVSVSCGIPDFRSPGGLYDTVRERFGMDEPQSLFDIEYFKIDPKPFFAFAKEILPKGEIKPSVTHRFIRQLEKEGKLLRNFSQNIDGLERVAGIEKVVSCHGSFATASCRRCSFQVNGEEIRGDIVAEKIPECSKCTGQESGEDEREDLEDPIMKPDIVFFGEQLADEFFDHINADIADADLLVVCGTSLKVAPVAKVPSCLNHSVPQILVNRVPLSRPNVFDVELLGDCDAAMTLLADNLGWTHLLEDDERPQVRVERMSPYSFAVGGPEDDLAEKIHAPDAQTPPFTSSG